MNRLAAVVAALALAGLAGCDKGGGAGGGDGVDGYSPQFAAGMLPEGFGDLLPWDSTLEEVAALFPEETYRVMRIESGPVYNGPVLTARPSAEGAAMPLGAYTVSFSFSLDGSAMRLRRIDMAQRPDNPTPVCDWLIETIGPMDGSEEGCIDEHVTRGVREIGASYCVGTADGAQRVDMECGRAREGGYEHVLMVHASRPE